MSEPRSLPADGHAATWVSADDGALVESVEIRWDNEAWTATGFLHGPRVQYVMRISPFWELRQLLLFRDLDEPDLWLGTDGRGRWGEVNGAHRPELDGARDATLAGAQFGWTPPIRRLPLEPGAEAHVPMLVVDPETLGVTTRHVAVRRHGGGRWNIDGSAVAVDELGLVADVPGRLRRGR